MPLVAVPATWGVWVDLAPLARDSTGRPGTAASSAAIPPKVTRVAIVTAPAIRNLKSRSALRRAIGCWAMIRETIAVASWCAYAWPANGSAADRRS